MHQDTYANFASLRKHKREGRDFERRIRPTKSSVAVIAPHGGKIEPGTSAAAVAIARDDFNLYLFEGIMSQDNFKILHITSTNFDDQACLDLLAKCDSVVAVHGLRGATNFVHVGGLDKTLRDSVCANLIKAEFKAEVIVTGDHAATSENNICNRGRAKMGVQLEVSKGLRDSLRGDALTRFANAVRDAIMERASTTEPHDRVDPKA